MNEQNVLFDLTAVEAPEGWQVTMAPSYGLGGTFACSSVEWQLLQER
jgi:hypothetical protein